MAIGAVEGAGRKPRFFLELPGDANVCAFTVAALGVGAIIGSSWRKLFGDGGGRA